MCHCILSLSLMTPAQRIALGQTLLTLFFLRSHCLPLSFVLKVTKGRGLCFWTNVHIMYLFAGMKRGKYGFSGFNFQFIIERRCCVLQQFVTLTFSAVTIPRYDEKCWENTSRVILRKHILHCGDLIQQTLQ